MKRLFIIAGAFLTLWASVYIFVKVKFPPERLKRLVEERISQNLGRKFQIEKVFLDLLHGLKIEGIFLGEDGKGPEQGFFKLKKLDLRYSLLPLLKRKLQLQKVSLLSPWVHLTRNEKGEWNFEDFMKKQESPTTLPLTVGLNRLDLDDLGLKIEMETPHGILTADISGINLKLKDLFVGREFKKEWGFKAKVSSRKDAQCMLRFNDNIINSRLELQIDCDALNPSNMVVKGSFALKDMLLSLANGHSQLPDLRLSFWGQLNSETGQSLMKELSLKWGKIFFVRATGKVENTKICFLINRSRLSLQPLWALLSGVRISEVKSIKLSGELDLDRSELKSTADGMRILGRARLRRLNLDYPKRGFSAKGLNLETYFSGDYDSLGFHEGVLRGKLEIPTIICSLNHTLEIRAQKMDLTFHTNLGEDFFPSKLDLQAQMKDLSGALLKMGASFALKRPSDSGEMGLENLSGYGELELKGLKVKRLLGEQLQGHVDFHFNMTSNFSKRARFDFSLSSEDLVCFYEDNYEPLPSIGLHGQGIFRIALSSKDLYLDKLNFTVNDLINAEIRGEFLSSNRQVRLRLERFLLNNPKLTGWFPAPLKEKIESLKIDGETKISGELNGKISDEGQFSYCFNSVVDLGAGLHYPAVFLRIDGLKGRGVLNGDSKGMEGHFSLEMEEISKEDIFNRPIKDIRVELKGSLKGRDRLRLKEALVQIPDLGSKIKFSGSIERLSSKPQTQMMLNLSFSSEDKVETVWGLFAQGEVKTQVQLDSSATLSGLIKIRDLNLWLGRDLQIEGIQGNLPFSQRLKFEEEGFESQGLKLTTYDLLRPYCIRSLLDLPNFKVTRIEIFGYEVSNLEMDLLIGGNRLEIPRFRLKLYGGNISGSCFVDLDQGDPSQVNYWFKAQIARVDLGKLPGAKMGEAKGSEITANMEFKGKGLNFKQGFDIEGEFVITDIGPRATEGLLRSLDPKGTDPAIRDARRLMNRGFKPKLISFQIRHGNFYPTIILSQPWYYPLKISGGRIELARIPIKFFLERVVR